jgi:hypothetical protein
MDSALLTAVPKRTNAIASPMPKIMTKTNFENGLLCFIEGFPYAFCLRWKSIPAVNV